MKNIVLVALLGVLLIKSGVVKSVVLKEIMKVLLGGDIIEWLLV